MPNGGLVVMTDSYMATQRAEVTPLAIYADRILKGIKPSELSVQVPAQFKLVVNAKTLGLDLPP